jgi:hypothetical protein
MNICEVRMDVMSGQPSASEGERPKAELVLAVLTGRRKERRTILPKADS